MRPAWWIRQPMLARYGHVVPLDRSRRSPAHADRPGRPSCCSRARHSGTHRRTHARARGRAHRATARAGARSDRQPVHSREREPRRLCQFATPARMREHRSRRHRPVAGVQRPVGRSRVHRVAHRSRDPQGAALTPGVRHPTRRYRCDANRSLQKLTVPLTSACGASQGTKWPQSRSRNGPTWWVNTAAAMRSKAG